MQVVTLDAGPSPLLDTDSAPPPPNGQALVVAHADAQAALQDTLAQIGFGGVFIGDPYAATLELARRPRAFQAVVLSLSALYPPELRMVEVLKRRFAHVDVILTDIAGRSATLAEAVALGADAWLEDDRLHRVALQTTPSARQSMLAPPDDAESPPSRERNQTGGPAASRETVLTSEELAALLEDECEDE